MTLYELQQATNTFYPLEVIAEIMEEMSVKAIILNLEQLKKGLNAEGKKFRRYRSKAYARRKNGMNSAPGFGNPDLRLKGDFYRGFTADIKGTLLEIYSTDSKAKWLEEGTKNEDGSVKMEAFADIYGLDQKSMVKFQADFLLAYNAKIREHLGLS